jgi:rhomboid protease GluP
MLMDGEIDFSAYTREELDNAIARMDRTRYPINARNLIGERQRRQELEKAAAALAVVSGTSLVPDGMVSAPKGFEVRFEPASSFFNWLGPSRNDFHLVGAGTVKVDDKLIHLQGRRFAYLIGIPVSASNELGRQYVVNAELQEHAVRFELRVPSENACGITLWLKTAAQADELFRLLPSERTTDFAPQLGRHLEFEQSLAARSPTTPVTYSLLGVCLFVYAGTALGTNQLWALSGPSVVQLGSNFGPYTTDGEWWRLVTCMFLHLGLLHLAFNMWALVSFGRLVERLLASAFYLLIYLIAGIAGSLGSVIWNPGVNSVGASGAIFGILGALLAVQVRNDGSIPINILRPLRNSSLIFTGCALSAGLVSGAVDNAAHLAGLTAGFLLGLGLSWPITGARMSVGLRVRGLGFALITAVFILEAGVTLAKNAAGTRLAGEGLFDATRHWFGPRERVALRRAHEASRAAKDNQLDSVSYAKFIDDEILPFWEEAKMKWVKIKLPTTSPAYESLQFIQSVVDDRIEAYASVVEGLQKNDREMVDDGTQQLQEIDERVEDKSHSSSK